MKIVVTVYQEVVDEGNSKMKIFSVKYCDDFDKYTFNKNRIMGGWHGWYADIDENMLVYHIDTDVYSNGNGNGNVDWVLFELRKLKLKKLNDKIIGRKIR